MQTHAGITRIGFTPPNDKKSGVDCKTNKHNKIAV